MKELKDFSSNKFLALFKGRVPLNATMEDLLKLSWLKNKKHWRKNKRLWKKFQSNYRKYLPVKIAREVGFRKLGEVMAESLRMTFERASFFREVHGPCLIPKK